MLSVRRHAYRTAAERLVTLGMFGLGRSIDEQMRRDVRVRLAVIEQAERERKARRKTRPGR